MRELIARLGGDDAHPARRAHRARSAPRAAASGAAAHRHQARLVDQPAASRLSGRGASVRNRARDAPRMARLRRRRSAGSATTATGFAFDNEGPRHRVFLEPFRLASPPGHQRRVPRLHRGRRLRTARSSGSRPAGARCRSGSWEAPLYWERDADGHWTEFTLAGTRALDGAALAEPVTPRQLLRGRRVRALGECRLPTEFEWEAAARGADVDGHFVEAGLFHPTASDDDTELRALYGDVWEWTQSAYVGYPGYVPSPGAIGEYNGKLMGDQWVLRGGSCATPRSHARVTLPQLLPVGRAVAVQRAFDWPRGARRDNGEVVPPPRDDMRPTNGPRRGPASALPCERR